MDINTQFQSILGRAPTSAENEYFQKFLTEGSIQPYEIGHILQATPEFQQAQLEKNTTAFGDKLSASNDQIMQRGADLAGAQATSRFAGLGRPNSSAMAAQVFSQQGQLAQGLAQQRQSALAQFYGQGLQQNQALYQQGGQNGLERAYGLRDETRQFGQQMQLARYQADNYDNYLNQANKKAKNGAMAGLAGSLAGAAIGGLVPGGGVLGAGLGAGIGGQVGGVFR